MIVDLYTDMRILLGWAWTYLIVAEMVGTTSGITYFINQQARYRNYENVYAAIMLIGLIGLSSDLLLGRLGRRLFPWQNPDGSGRGTAAVAVSRRPMAQGWRGRLEAAVSSPPVLPRNQGARNWLGIRG